MGTSSPIETIQALGRYTLVEKIGEGYLGSVYRGFDQNLGQAVAVRILCDGIKWDEKIEEIYNCQCQTVVGLRHAGIASVFEFGKEGQFHYIVMESLGNSTLKALIAQKSAMAVEAKLSIMIQIAEGLSYAHKNGVLHRDLEPAKIHLTVDGTPKIRDFAIASVLMKHLPHPWIRFGTPIYLSPEQIQQKDCDQRSDIFSAGTIFYELLTYLHPFHDRDSNKALDNILQESQIPTFDLFPHEPPGIWSILKICLAKDPNDRYQSMDELSSACRDLLKDLGEDTRLMLSELYAALSPLTKAVAQPGAPDNAITLLRDIQKLLRGEKEADYVSLDKLMNTLIEQYPTVQAISGSLPTVASAFSELPLGEVKAGIAEEPGPSSKDPSVEMQSPSPVEMALAAVLTTESPELSTMASKQTPAPLSDEAEQQDDKGEAETLFSDIWDLSSEMQFTFETSFVKPEEETLFASELIPDKEPSDSTVCASAVPGGSPEIAEKSQVPPVNEPEPAGKTGHPEISCAEIPMSSPEPPPLPDGLFAPSGAEEAPGDKLGPDVAEPGMQTIPDSIVDTQFADEGKVEPATRYRGIPRRSYRIVAALLSLLLIAASAYIFLGTDFKRSMGSLMKAYLMDSGIVANTFSRWHNQKSPSAAATTEGQKPKAAAISPTNHTASLDPQSNPSAEQGGRAANQPPEDLIARISGLIGSGKIQLARVELDKLQRAYPTAYQVSQLRKQWESKNSMVAQEQTRKEEEQLKAARQQRDAEWNGRLAALLTRGQYDEASSALNLWLAEDPGNLSAQEIGAKIGEIQRYLGAYASAMAENKYSEALTALNNGQRLNPGDPAFAELRRQIESRKAAAKASLTIRRLGAKGILLLDGRPIGSDGETENESIPIGTHTLTVVNGSSVVISRRQEFLENQQIVLVYDLEMQLLRPLADADRELLAQRKAIEEVRYFDVEHEHGAFRGSCRGLLMIDYLDVAYRPSAGSHGFRMPSKLFKLIVRGKSADLINISDNKRFNSFKFRDEQAADNFKRIWDEIKALAR